ncbi:class I SAM-dependent methyltransferase [Thermodesulfobacteriota bacterium]
MVNKYNELLEDLRNAYDSKALERNGLSIEPWKSQERERFLLEIKQKGTERLLEIGCGTGRDAKYFESKGLEVICVDLSATNIALCRDKGLNAHVMDFFHLDFPPSSFDAVFALNCLLHVPVDSLSKALVIINKILKPTGLFYMGVYGGRNAEGVLSDDNYEPKRFFCTYTDTRIIQIVSEIFDLLYFRRMDIGRPVHFQSMIFRSRAEQVND